MEAFKQNSQSNPELFIEDYEESPFYSLLKRLPEELALKHLSYIEENNIDEMKAVLHLESILEKRSAANTETAISDPKIQELFEGQEAEILKKLETEVFTSKENSLGFGYTAKVKRFDLENNGEILPIAVKYLVSPTSKTLSASGEHDMIHEVELLTNIEEVERGAELKHLAVPHPYFHHKNTNMQCYGMHMVDGADLEQTFLSKGGGVQFSAEAQDKIAQINTDELYEEVDEFFKRMHTYCIHGDIKPKNLMFDNTGKLFIIDFGQSVLKNDIDEKGMDQYHNLMESEVKTTKEILRGVLRKVNDSIAKRET
jgi:tRNA A-37 threonylcarbamoyl transferase component Bud32